MLKQKKLGKGVVYYSDLIPELEHFFTTRLTNVDEYADDICEYLKIDKINLIHPEQTHSSNVEFVKEGQQNYPDTDSLILTNSTQAIYLRFADCTPVILYDKKSNIGAIAHAGWRGTASKIVPKTVSKMLEYSKTEEKDIYAIIGPAIGSCCYEVGKDVVEKISLTIKDKKNIIISRQKADFIDLKRANAQQLIEYGIPKENIDICPFCTSCNNNEFFSYRKESGTIQRHNAVIKLKS